MERKTLGVRLDSKTWKKLEIEAERKNITVSELARRKIAQPLEYDPHLNKFVRDFIKRVDVSPSEFYEILLYDFMARFDSEIEVEGAPGFTFIPFLKTPEGEISHGDNLYKELKTTHVSMYTYEKKKRLLEKEAAGEEISSEDRRFLIAHRAGQTWLKSKEYASEKTLFEKYKNLGQKAKAKGLVPKDLDIPDIQVGKLYEGVVNGNLSEEDFVEEMSNPFFISFYDRNKFASKKSEDG